MILFQPVNKAIWISSEGFGGFDSYKSHDVKQNFRSVPKHMRCDSQQWKLHNDNPRPSNIFRPNANVEGLKLPRSGWKAASGTRDVPLPGWEHMVTNSVLTATSSSLPSYKIQCSEEGTVPSPPPCIFQFLICLHSSPWPQSAMWIPLVLCRA